MPEVKSRKIIHVTGLINTTVGPAVFSKSLKVDFKIDDMIVTSWTASGALGTSGEDTYILKMNGVGELFHFRALDSVPIRNIFRIGNNVDGVHDFQIMTTTGAIATNIEDMYIMFTLEFIEFH